MTQQKLKSLKFLNHSPSSPTLKLAFEAFLKVHIEKITDDENKDWILEVDTFDMNILNIIINKKNDMKTSKFKGNHILYLTAFLSDLYSVKAFFMHISYWYLGVSVT